MARFLGRLFGPEPEKRPLDRDTVNEALALLRDGRKVEAIKVVRMRTGMGLVEAKNLVEDMEAGRPVPFAPDPGNSLADRVRELLDQDRRPEAVTMVARETGMTDDESARFVDSLDR
ncbi:ribosomal protein L7/L12 [Nocardiopsis sp. MG754419]|uniref:ribosomal protein L7/L12 n=1 Tax=Nocardiopsis sp. MG754419 TaxID=2259865 RepID=UPI001BA6318C|nr:ribosomal protein L7/L12 [Nocardiopsis sp. MG754419]MBR8741572.1 50S ribosomal protein L7/L12 [Nocardiopsis sp. MG754419]